MVSDEIIIEVWRNRDAYAARHHDSLASVARMKPLCGVIRDNRGLNPYPLRPPTSLRTGFIRATNLP